MRLGDRLVLLDTPGLHSGEQANAALTRRYLDSADGVLWLTGSSSPGQVRELDDLGRELLRRKPLLPIITRSDCYDEDEVDGEIRKTLCNKSAADRDLQQADVESRARGKLAELGADPGLLKTPVSISVRMASAQTPAAMAEAGFDALYAALRALIQPMLAYRQRKPAEMLLHYLQENVAGPIARDIRPGLDALRRQAQAALAWQQDQRTRLAEASLRRILPALPALLDNPAADLPAQPGAHDAASLRRRRRRGAGRLPDRHPRRPAPSASGPPRRPLRSLAALFRRQDRPAREPAAAGKKQPRSMPRAEPGIPRNAGGARHGFGGRPHPAGRTGPAPARGRRSLAPGGKRAGCRLIRRQERRGRPRPGRPAISLPPPPGAAPARTRREAARPTQDTCH
ncbi:dynamin family protein [Achromobacter sp. DMS1]|uniref:dynamin family protein n=1 Tax=Achromobacter sp. DMS1 TaxID=1688405 RepID=UPI00350EEF34